MERNKVNRADRLFKRGAVKGWARGRWKSAVFMAGWIFMLPGSLFAADGLEIDTNPALKDSTGAGVPDLWEWSPSPNGTTTEARIEMVEGRATVVLRDDDKQAGLGMQMVVPVEGSRYYRFSARLMGEDIPLYMIWLDAKRKTIGKESFQTQKPPRDRFVEMGWAQEAPEQAKFLKIRIYRSTSSTGTVRVQEPRLTFVTRPVVRTYPWETKLGCLPSHPRLLPEMKGLAEVKEKVKSDPVTAHGLALLKAYGERTLDQPLLERKLEGRRLLGVSRAAVRRILTTGLLHHLTGDEKWGRRTREEILNVCGFSDWNPDHFLDVAEMSTAVALGYDWMYETFREPERETIAKALVELGLEPSKVTTSSWPTGSNNWNQVCYGGTVLASLAVADRHLGIALDCLRRAAGNVASGLTAYGPDGAFPEGPGYWEFGTTYSILASSALMANLGEDFGIRTAEGFMESAVYMRQMIGPTGLLFNYADCPPLPAPSAALAWMARERGEPGLLEVQRKQILETSVTNPYIDRFLPLQVLYQANVPVATTGTKPLALSYVGRGPNPVVVFRSGPGDQAAWLGIKGGSPGTSHAHMDGGSFVFDADGERWVMDLGMQDYNGLEKAKIDLWNMGQDSERWKIYRIGDLGHNVVRVGGKGQSVKGFGALLKAGPDRAVFDLSALYGEALGSMRRGGRLSGRTAVVVDEITGGAVDGRLVSSFHTPASVSRTSEGLELNRNGHRLTVAVLEPREVAITFVPAAGREPFDAPNPGVTRVDFAVNIQARAKTRVVLALIPEGDKMPEIPPLLDTW